MFFVPTFAASATFRQYSCTDLKNKSAVTPPISLRKYKIIDELFKKQLSLPKHKRRRRS